LYDLLAEARGISVSNCANTLRQARRRLSETTRLSGEIAQSYGLGYAPPGWDNLLQALGKDPQTQAQMERAGLLIKKDGGGLYDRFRDRVMFPFTIDAPRDRLRRSRAW